METGWRVHVFGYFYTLALYNDEGRNPSSLAEAIAVARDLYGNEFEVYNGLEGFSTEDT